MMDDEHQPRTAEQGDRPSSEIGERPTLKTIARLAGLAVPTVSRALSDAADIGEETKRRVREIADRIGYRPNRAGVRLRTGKTNVISIVMSTEYDMMNLTARLIASIAASLRGTSYHLIITPYFPTEDPMDPVRYIVETGSADGIIMNQTQPRDPRVAYLLARDFPFATHGRTDWQHPYADFDNAAFGAISVEQLAARGRKRIGLIAPPLVQSYAGHLVKGARDAARRLDCEAGILEGASCDSPSEQIERAVVESLAGPNPFDAFIIPSASAVIAAVSGLESLDLVLGRDIDISAKEAVPFLSRFRREIFAHRESANDAGRFLAQALMHRIANPGAEPMQWLEVPQSETGMGKPVSLL